MAMSNIYCISSTVSDYLPEHASTLRGPGWIVRMRSLDLLLISFFFIHFAYFLASTYGIISTENVFRPDNQARPVARDFTLHLRSPDLLAEHTLFYFCKHDTTKRHKSHKSGFKFNIIILK